jgi:hypothetical protein
MRWRGHLHCAILEAVRERVGAENRSPLRQSGVGNTRDVMSASKITLIVCFAVSVLLNGARVLGEWAVCWNDYIAGALLFLAPLLLLPAAWSCAIAVLSAVVGLFSRFRQVSLVTLCCCLIFVSTYYLGVYAAGLVRRSIFISAAVRGTPLVRAIEKYEQNNGHPPASLNSLLPEYLSAIPQTGFATAPHFAYHVYNRGDRKFEPRWEVSVNPAELPNSDALVYWPEANYPATLPEGGIERLGRWAYIDDEF